MRLLTSDFGLADEAAAAIAQMGAQFDAQVLAATRNLFADRWDLSVPETAVRRRDVAYGEDSRQVLNVIGPGGTNDPVLLYVPGGGFTGGDKSLYAHLAARFCRLGFLAVTMNYRLAPTHGWPAGAQDVAAAIDWLSENSRELGADPSTIYIVAQSAGATHTAGALFDRDLRPAHFAAVRGAVLMSGVYRLEEAITHPGGRAYFGEDATRSERAPIGHVRSNELPINLTLAEYDPPFVVDSTLALASALTANGSGAPACTWLRGHNHVSPVLGMGVPGDELAEAITRTLRPT